MHLTRQLRVAAVGYLGEFGVRARRCGAHHTVPVGWPGVDVLLAALLSASSCSAAAAAAGIFWASVRLMAVFFCEAGYVLEIGLSSGPWWWSWLA